MRLQPIIFIKSDLNYKGKKYIIETKVNRQDLASTINQGISQVCEKYLTSEHYPEGYLVVYDTKTPAGAGGEPRYHQVNDKKITSFNIGIGRSHE